MYCRISTSNLGCLNHKHEIVKEELKKQKGLKTLKSLSQEMNQKVTKAITSHKKFKLQIAENNKH